VPLLGVVWTGTVAALVSAYFTIRVAGATGGGKNPTVNAPAEVIPARKHLVLAFGFFPARPVRRRKDA
jgi:hypothetical protein